MVLGKGWLFSIGNGPPKFGPVEKGRKYLVIPLEHSAILLSCIKRYLVLKTNFRSF